MASYNLIATHRETLIPQWKISLLLHAHPEDSNCNICQNVDIVSTCGAAKAHKPKLHITQAMKIKDNIKFPVRYACIAKH
jgi:hypothetical protein